MDSVNGLLIFVNHVVNLPQDLLDLVGVLVGDLVLKDVLKLLQDGNLGVETDLVVSDELGHEGVGGIMTSPKMATFALYDPSALFAVVNREFLAVVVEHLGVMSVHLDDALHDMAMEGISMLLLAAFGFDPNVSSNLEVLLSIGANTEGAALLDLDVIVGSSFDKVVSSGCLNIRGEGLKILLSRYFRNCKCRK
jgi:hypothetical protein